MKFILFKTLSRYLPAKNTSAVQHHKTKSFFIATPWSKRPWNDTFFVRDNSRSTAKHSLSCSCSIHGGMASGLRASRRLLQPTETRHTRYVESDAKSRHVLNCNIIESTRYRPRRTLKLWKMLDTKAGLWDGLPVAILLDIMKSRSGNVTGIKDGCGFMERTLDKISFGLFIKEALRCHNF